MEIQEYYNKLYKECEICYGKNASLTVKELQNFVFGYIIELQMKVDMLQEELDDWKANRDLRNM